MIARRCWLSLVILLASLACGDVRSNDPADRVRRFLALGDSYTAGIRIEDVDRWPVQLAERLQQEGIPLETHIIAVSGWTVTDLVAGIDEVAPPPDYDLVSVFIGTNDHFAEQPPTVFESEFETLLDRAIALARGKARRVLVVGMPDWTRTPNGRRYKVPSELLAAVDEYNRILERQARARGAGFVALLDMSRRYDEAAELFVSDGLHPNRALCGLWAEAIFDPALRILSRDEGG